MLTKLKYVFGVLIGKGQPLYTPEGGARTQTLCAVMPEDELVVGAYFADGVVRVGCLEAPII